MAQLYASVDAMLVFLFHTDLAENLRPPGYFNAVIVAIMVPQSLLMLAGGISMHQHKRRWLALVGAWAGISPFCGCYVFSLISGIWALMVLLRPEVKALFAANQRSSTK